MTDSNNTEVRRLCVALERLEKLTEKGSIEREALRKAGFALHLAFVYGRRQEVEQLYENAPLTEEQLERIRRWESYPNA